ncbi:MAG: co-chaperone GroES [Alphaproteobacteria bacterium]|nr:co-chaperone GroES [Alphaproteobacteria bacterium]
MNIRPLYDRVIIKRKDEPAKSKGGLFLPETAKEKPIQGEVLAVGQGRVSDDGELTPLQVEVGNVVVFGKYAGTELKLDGEEVLILREDDILGVIE